MTDLRDEFDRQRVENLAILAGWTTQFSGGHLTIDASGNRLSFRRVDGAELYPSPFSDGQPITGYITGDVWVPTTRRLTRRNRRHLRMVAEAVRSTMFHIEREGGDTPAEWFGAFLSWCRVYRVTAR